MNSTFPPSDESRVRFCVVAAAADIPPFFAANRDGIRTWATQAGAETVAASFRRRGFWAEVVHSPTSRGLVGTTEVIHSAMQ